MTETVLNRSPLASAISPQSKYDRRRERAAAALLRRPSSKAGDMALETKPRPPFECVSNALLRRVKRFTLGAAFFGAALSIVTSVALSQGAEGTPEQQEACTPDAMKLCSDFVPDPGRVKGCLIQHIATLSLPCRGVFEKGRGSDFRSTSRSPRKSN